jgi:hypothetical protein
MKTNYTSALSEHSNRLIPHHVVAERAYGIWLAKGQPLGCDHDHWVQAESQLDVSQPQEESLSSQLEHLNDPLSTDIERALDSMAPSFGRRSATSL